MANHNKVVKTLASEARRRDWEVQVEPRLRDSRGRLGIPDLVLTKGQKGLIIDVTLPYETSPTTLTDADKQKRRKYFPFKDAIAAGNPQLTSIKVRGFPVGARGKWHKSLDSTLDLIDIPRSRKKILAKRIARMVITNSARLAKSHYKIAHMLS